MGVFSLMGTVGPIHRYVTFLGVATAALALGLWSGGGVAHADRWGTPYMASVAVGRTVVYTRPDRASPPVGPLNNGAIVVVVDERAAPDGVRWAEILDGFAPLADLEELYKPWLAQVSVRTVSIYAKPFLASGIRRTAREGDLLRVTGVSAGLEGDTSLWWATTEGYLPMRTLRWATDDWAHWWELPAVDEAARGWWGTLTSRVNVRVASNRESLVVGAFAGGERVKILAEEEGEPLDGNPLWYRIDGGRYAGARIHSSVVRRLPDPKPNTTPPPPGTPAGPWIVVDRAAASLTLMGEDRQPMFVTYVSIGQAGAATPVGTYTTFGKFIGDRMSSRNVENPSRPYDLPNVPYTEYYREGGFAIHGTYWHDGFGTPESQGCINLSWADAAYLFAFTRPGVPEGANERWAGAGGATPVVVLN